MLFIHTMALLTGSFTKSRRSETDMSRSSGIAPLETRRLNMQISLQKKLKGHA